MSPASVGNNVGSTGNVCMEQACSKYHPASSRASLLETVQQSLHDIHDALPVIAVPLALLALGGSDLGPLAQIPARLGIIVPAVAACEQMFPC